MTVKGGSRPACAACRFQRRRCSSDCPLAPYFPANQPKIFQNVHRLYGVGNVMKILNMMKDDDEKEEAMKSIKYESYIRDIYPVDGCCGRINDLRQKLLDSVRELHYYRFMIHAYRTKKDPTQGYSDPNSDPMGNNNDENNNNGVYYFGSSSRSDDHNYNDDTKVYDHWDDRVKTNVDMTQIEYQFDECRLSGSPEDYMNTGDDSTPDDQLWYMASKDEHDEFSSFTKPVDFC